MPDVNAEMAKLYLEAAGLVVKLTNFIKVSEIPNSKIYLDAANDFINRNSFYKIAVNGFISPVKQYDVKPAISNTVQTVTQNKPMPKTFSYKSNAPEPQKPKPPVNNDDDLW